MEEVEYAEIKEEVAKRAVELSSAITEKVKKDTNIVATTVERNHGPYLSTMASTSESAPVNACVGNVMAVVTEPE